MQRRQLTRWGAWPARLASAVLIFYGAYRAINARLVLDSLSGTPDAATSLAAVFAGRLFDGIVLIVLGLVAAALTWLTRRKARAAAITGLILSFFLAGLVVAYALTADLNDLFRAAAITVGACLLLAGASTLMGRDLFESKGKRNG